MPGIDQKQCFPDLQHYAKTDEVIPGHRDKCDAHNRQNTTRIGMWFATIRCFCECHEDGTPESYDVLIFENGDPPVRNPFIVETR